MRTGTNAFLGLCALALAAPLGAQDVGGTSRELRPFVGWYVPTGMLRDAFARATSVGVQAALETTRHPHVVANVAWTRTRDRFGHADDLAYIWQYDVGAEVNVVRGVGGGWRLKPFVGAGGGGRTYDYQSAALATHVCTTGYAAAGSELQTGSVALRVEGRGYLACYKSPTTGRQHSARDVGLSLGLAYHLR